MYSWVVLDQEDLYTNGAGDQLKNTLSEEVMSSCVDRRVCCPNQEFIHLCYFYFCIKADDWLIDWLIDSFTMLFWYLKNSLLGLRYERSRCLLWNCLRVWKTNWKWGDFISESAGGQSTSNQTQITLESEMTNRDLE